jgi:hypothetical protein
MPKWGELPRHSPRVGESLRFFISLRGYADASSRESDDGGWNQSGNGNRKGVLAASGRGAIEEGRVPVSTNRANFKRRQRRGSDPDHDNASCHDHERHDRVHHDAELAMIGVTPNRMHMRYLGDG